DRHRGRRHGALPRLYLEAFLTQGSKLAGTLEVVADPVHGGQVRITPPLRVSWRDDLEREPLFATARRDVEDLTPRITDVGSALERPRLNGGANRHCYIDSHAVPRT